MKTLNMSFEKYDNYCKLLKAIPNRNPKWIPAMNNVNKYIHLPCFLLFLLWINETSEIIPENQEKKKQLTAFLREHIVLTDD